MPEQDIEDQLKLKVESVSNIPPKRVPDGQKWKGEARVFLGFFGFSISNVSWYIFNRKTFVTLPGFDRGIDGKKKYIRTISFENKVIEKAIARAVKAAVRLALEERDQTEL